MALREPGMLEFARLLDTEELATNFARELGLLISDQQILSITAKFFIHYKNIPKSR